MLCEKAGKVHSAGQAAPLECSLWQSSKQDEEKRSTKRTVPVAEQGTLVRQRTFPLPAWEVVGPNLPLTSCNRWSGCKRNRRTTK